MHQWTVLIFVIFRVKTGSQLEAMEEVSPIMTGKKKNHSRWGIPKHDGRILVQWPDDGPVPPESSSPFDLHQG